MRGGLNPCLKEPQNIIWHEFEERPALWYVFQESLEFESREVKLPPFQYLVNVLSALNCSKCVGINMYLMPHMLLIVMHLERI